MTPYLFVYGTLKSSATGRLGQAQRRRLAREGRGLGPATVNGRLYDLGRYPGLVLSLIEGDVAHGEVVELVAPQTSLLWLDVYEGLRPGCTEGAEYARCTVAARLADGRDITVWAYVCRQEPDNARCIDSGVWPA